MTVGSQGGVVVFNQVFTRVQSRSGLGWGSECHILQEEPGSWGPAVLFTPIPMVSKRQGSSVSIQIVLSNAVVLA